ncbi:MAG: hypothetical protein MK109_08460 [Dehalococcoidia bacterium]|nr:hypothetical protein [Dehalococcoidia bacterium]
MDSRRGNSTESERDSFPVGADGYPGPGADGYPGSGASADADSDSGDSCWREG